MSAVAVLPTTLTVEAAWQRYVEVARAAIDDPRLLLDRAHCECLATAWAERRDLFLAMDKSC